MRKLEPNISRQDFIIWDTINNKPAEDYDTIYHYTTIVELINTGELYQITGLNILKGQEIVCLAELTPLWQKIISKAIEQNK